jgi:hypothetical protein
MGKIDKQSESGVLNADWKIPSVGMWWHAITQDMVSMMGGGNTWTRNATRAI